MQGRIKFFNLKTAGVLLFQTSPAWANFFFHFRDMAVVPLVDREQIFQPGTRVEFEPSKGPDGRDRAVRHTRQRRPGWSLHNNGVSDEYVDQSRQRAVARHGNA